MSSRSTHRKTVRHFEAERTVHELTFSCYQRRSLLVRTRWLEMFSESVSRAVSRHDYELIAFAWMPDHVHLLVRAQGLKCSISGLLRAIKRPYSFRIKKLLEQASDPLLHELTIQQRPGVKTFRFWQEGPGYDRNLTESKSIGAAIEYIHLNPVRRGLCTKAVDWKWSSARSLLLNDKDPLLPSVSTHWMLDCG